MQRTAPYGRRRCISCILRPGAVLRNPNQLDGVRKEGTPVLPGLRLR